jgi:hypothetical protein
VPTVPSAGRTGTEEALRTALVTLAVVVASHLGARAGAGPAPRVDLQPGAGLRLSADELAYRPGRCSGAPAQGSRENCLELRGRVAIELGALRLQAARLTVELDREGRPLELRAAGGVELRSGEASGRAAQAVLQVGGSSLELTGAARMRVTSLKLELEGEHIELDLTSGGLRIRRARARLELPPVPSGGRHARR